MSTEDQQNQADDQTRELNEVEPEESTASEPAPAAEDPVQKPRKKLGLVIGGAVVAVAAIAAAIGIPPLLHQAKVDDYQAAVSATMEAHDATFDTTAETYELRALTALQLDEATALQADLEALGKTDKSVIPEGQTKALSAAAAELKKSLPKIDDEQAAFLKELASREKKATPEQLDELPDTWIGANPAQAAVFAQEAEPVKDLSTVAPENVTKQTVADAKAALLNAENDLVDAKALHADEAEQNAAVLDAVAASLPALNTAAQKLPEQAKSVVAAQTKGGDALAKVTATAKDASDFATADEFTLEKKVVTPKAKDAKGEAVKVAGAHRATLTIAKIQAYVTAANTATKAHADAVAAEAAAAEAAAQEAAYGGGGGDDWSGYDGGSNGWSGTGGYGSDGWTGSGGGGTGSGGGGGTGGGGSGSGGGGTGGGGGGGTGSGGGGTGGGGSDGGSSGGYTCPGAPAGWFPDGGSFTTNGVTCPTYSPPSDEWG